MSASSAVRVLDPLAEPEATCPDTGLAVATPPRSERTAPDLTAMAGVEAVAIVRAGGFIAAIEPLASELPKGTVIEQVPLPGARLTREGVITLRLATPPADAGPVATEHKAALATDHAARPAGPDDTEEWFRALAPARREAPAGGRSGRRRRKHRPQIPPASERFFDPPPAPSVGPSESPRIFTPLPRTRERASLWLRLASSVCVRVSSRTALQWRRASALLAGALLLALLGTRLLTSSDRRANTTRLRALAPTTDAYVPVRRSASVVPRQRGRPSPAPRAGRSRTRNDSRARKRNAAPVAVVTARPTHQSEAAAAPATSPAQAASSQFAYLGQ